MKRSGGMLASLFVILTFFGVSNLPKSSEEAPATRSNRPAAASRLNAGPSAVNLSSPCVEISERLERFLDLKEESPVYSRNLPDSCYDREHRATAAKDVRALPEVEFAIATVPNPVNTHLPLMFDRMVEGIQQAAQDNGYTYDGSWFPWQEPNQYTSFADEQNADQTQKTQQAQPGLLTFRRSLAYSGEKPYQGGLIIFLAAEQPTGGIRDDEFVNALAWIERLGGFSGKRPLRILGPAFSGSLPSLQRDLDRGLETFQLRGKVTIKAWSGTVSSGSGYRWFANWIRRQAPGSVFHTAMENDSLMVDRFCQYLLDQNYDLKYVAFLSEDETAFGGDTGAPCSQAIRLYYPRDIATLRSAYEKQSIRTAAKSETTTSESSTTLRGDLSEPASNDHDSVRTYGAQLTPLAQESTLLDITDRLREKGIQFIILRSTNSLDQIFLSEFLRRSWPGGRVVIDGADLLFDRGAEGRALRGVMLLTTYPLITADQDWTPSLTSRSAGSYRTFGQDTAEAEYIAARKLFHRYSANVPIHDYAPPGWAREQQSAPNGAVRPPTWLTVVSHRQLWPLAVLTRSTKSMAPSILLPSAAVDTGDAKPLRLPSSMWMFVMVFVICSAVHGWFCWNGSIVGLPRARAYFTPISRFQHPALIALGAALIALAAAVIANASGLFWSYVRTSPFRENGTAIALTMALAAAVALTGAGCFGNFKLRTLQASPFLTPKARIRKWRLIAAAAGAGFLVAFLWIQIYMALRLTSGNAVPVFWRSIHLFSGASPLVPQLLLLLGAYLWFWCNLRGVSLFGDDRPVLPRLRDLPKRDNKPMMPMFSWEVAGKAVENAALPLSASYMKRLLTTFLVVVLACGVALRGLSIRTLGEQAFGRFIFWWVCISIAVVLTDGVQMWRAWNALRELLRFLDRLALRRTLRSLKGLAWGTIWKLSGNVLEERYRATSLQFESLRHLENAMRKWIPGNAAEAQNWLAVTQKLSACRQRFDSFAIWYVSLCRGASSVTAARNADLTKPRQYQLKLASTAGAIMERILLPEWRKETESLIFDRSAERGQTENLISVAKLPLHLRAAEEFFVLPYLAFIQNSLGRIRTIAIGDLWLFLCMTLAISSYPFDPLNILGGIFLAVFLVYGGIAALVYSQMSRDATLSHITNTRPGELGWEFWERLVAFGVGPLLGLLTTLFPSLADFVFSWLQPGAQALH